MQRKLSQLPINGNMLCAAQNNEQYLNTQHMAFHLTIKAGEVAL